MIGVKQILANRSEGENPGRFAKIARTMKNQYFLTSFASRKCLVTGLLDAKFDVLKEVCQNGGWNPVTIGFSSRAVANLESRFTGLKQLY